MIKISGLCKSFDSEKYVLNDINLEIDDGEIYGIIGQSGAGKSTLLRCLNGLEEFNKGTLTVNGKEVNKLSEKELRHLRQEQGMIFQNFNLLNRLTVFDNIALPLRAWKFSEDYIKNKVEYLLKVVELDEKRNSKPGELSGGQKQRVAIARALSLEPKMLLCDEATSALDPRTTKSILSLLKSINEKFNITIVIVTHQMEVIKDICHKVAIINDGKISESGVVSDLFLNPSSGLEKLVAHEDLLPGEGVNIRLYFSKDLSQRCVITSMARELDIDFSIACGKLERFRDDVVGSLTINISSENKEKVISYLKAHAIPWEVI